MINFEELKKEFNEIYEKLPMDLAEPYDAWHADIQCSAKEFEEYFCIEAMEQYLEEIRDTELSYYENPEEE